MIGTDQWRAYNEACASVTGGAARRAEAEVLAWLDENPGASVAQAREAAQRILEACAEDGCRDAAALAAAWYDAQGKEAGAALDRAVTLVAVDRDSLRETVRYQAAKLADGDKAAFAAAVGEWAENEAKASLNATVMANVGRDRRKGVKFARVTSGPTSCGFCLMLASRGAVYRTRQTAGELGRYHRHCNCKIVPCYSGNKYEVLVEGHDPKDALKLWQECEEIEGIPELNASQKRLLKTLLLSSDQPADEIIERLESAPSSKMLFSDGQLGKKFGKHCIDWGLDPASEDDRLAMLRTTADIIDYADEVTRGDWWTQPGPCSFYRKGGDIVITDANDVFVTVMRGGADNKRYRATVPSKGPENAGHGE